MSLTPTPSGGTPDDSGATAGGGGWARRRRESRRAAAPADLVLFDNDLVSREEAVVSAFDRGVLYGESLFETVKVVGGAPCLWDRHGDRLAAGCRELGIPLDLPAVERGLELLLEHRPVERGMLRVQVTGGVQPGGGRGITAPSEGRRARVVASVAEVVPSADAAYSAGVAVISATETLRPSPWLKSGNYLASVRAKALAESADAFECVLVGGEPPGLLEGSFSNVLLWNGETLVSPPEGLRLPGITVGVVLEEAARAGVAVAVRPIGLDEVTGAAHRAVTGGVPSGRPAPPARSAPSGRPAPAGLMLTGSLLGVCPCSHLDGVALSSTVEVSALLRGRLLAREEESRRVWTSGRR